MSRQFPAAPPAPSTPLVPVGNPAPSQTLLDRTGRWIEQNRNLLILGATVAVSAGAGYYLYNRSSSGGSGPSSGSDRAGTSSSKKNKKKNKKKGKFVPGEGIQGPLLEEIQPATPAAPQTDAAKEGREEHQEKDILETIPEGDALAAMSEAERNQLGAKLKDKGNQYYQAKQFHKAVDCYTKAIEVSVKRDAVFFSNRAACYTNYSPPEYGKVVEDCDEALKLDRTYAKALKRRAAALERLERYEEALRDYTATTIIESFKDEKSNEAMDRCLKKLVEKKHEELVKTREPSLPSYGLIAQYLAAFRPHVKPTLPENPSQGDQTLNLAFDALAAGDFTHAFSFTNEAIEQGLSSSELKAEALNLRGTFKFLSSDPKGSLEDFEQSIDASPTSQAWVKLAAVHTELGDQAKAFGDFESAIQLNADDPDIYYHRGQVYFLAGEYANAQTDYEKSTELDNTFIFSHIQHAMCQYKLGNVGSSTAAFRRILRQFPDRSEAYNYYGEILLDTQKFPEAIERFDRALEIDKDRKPPNVLPLVNKAYAMIHWQQDFDAAEKLCKEAFERDPGCDSAVATLAQVSLTKSKIDDAIDWFEKHLKIARSDAEIVTTIQYLEASKTQKEFMATYPEYAGRLSQIAQNVQ